MNSCEFTLSIAALANSIACQLDEEQLELAALAAEYLAESLKTIALQRAVCEKHSSGSQTAEDAELITLAAFSD